MKKIISFFVCLMMIFSYGIQTIHGETIYESDREQARNGNVMLKITGHHSTLGNKECLHQINLMRYRACRHQEVNPDDKNKEEKLSLKTDYGETPTADELSQSNGDYVPMKWSYELEKVAEIRSVEACICEEHVRPNANESEYMNKVKVDGKSGWSYGENLAWYGDMQSDINAWYSERSLYVQNPKTNENAIGHYTNMIAPSNNYVGLSTFTATDLDGYENTCSALEDGNSRYAGYNGLTYSEKADNLNEDCGQKVEVELSACDLSLHVDDVLHFNKTQKAQVYASYRCPYTGTTTKWPVVSRVLWSSTDKNVFQVDYQGEITAGAKAGDAELQALVNNKLLAKTIRIGHVWVHDRAYTDLPATCVSEGKKYLVCSECGEKEEKDLPIDENAHGETKLENVKAATCTETGYSGDTVCSLCGKVLKKGHLIGAKGHKFVRYNTGDASYMLVCLNCGETHTYGKTNQNTSTSEPQAVKKPYLETQTKKTATNGSEESAPVDENAPVSNHKHTYQWIVDGKGDSLKECTICHQRLYPKAKSLLNLVLLASSNKIKMHFQKIKGTSSYTIYRAVKGTTFKKYKTIKTTSFTDRKLKKHTIYGYMIVSHDPKKTKSMKCYCVTGNSKGKQANVKRLSTVKNIKVKVNQTKKLKVKSSYYGKKKKALSQRFGKAIRYASNKPEIATVNSQGIVKAVRKGHCTLYIYGQNGVYKSVSVTVI